MRLKSCSSTRYEAIEDLPAQIPGSSQSCRIMSKRKLASAQPNKHDSTREPILGVTYDVACGTDGG